CNRLSEIGYCYFGVIQLSQGYTARIPPLPAGGPLGPMIIDVPEVGCGFVPLREVEVGVPAVPPVVMHLRSKLDGLGKIANGLVPLLPIEVDSCPAGPALRVIRLQCNGFRKLGDRVVPL